MGGVDREELLGAIRAASEEGARKALANFSPEKGNCALFALHGSEEARVHARHHDQIGRYFAPFVRKAEGLAVTIASWAFWVVIVASVLIIILYSIRNENQYPYGTSYLPSIPFVAQILLTIHNSVRLNWERYGDPSFKIIYKESKGDIGEKTLA